MMIDSTLIILFQIPKGQGFDLSLQKKRLEADKLRSRTVVFVAGSLTTAYHRLVQFIRKCKTSCNTIEKKIPMIYQNRRDLNVLRYLFWSALRVSLVLLDLVYVFWAQKHRRAISLRLDIQVTNPSRYCCDAAPKLLSYCSCCLSHNCHDTHSQNVLQLINSAMNQISLTDQSQFGPQIQYLTLGLWATLQPAITCGDTVAANRAKKRLVSLCVLLCQNYFRYFAGNIYCRYCIADDTS